MPRRGVLQYYFEVSDLQQLALYRITHSSEYMFVDDERMTIIALLFSDSIY